MALADILSAALLVVVGTAFVLAVYGIVRSIVRPGVRRGARRIVVALFVAVCAAIDIWFYGGSGNFRVVN